MLGVGRPHSMHQICYFLGYMKNHLGHKVASTKLVEPITRRFVAAIEQFVRDQDIPLICFEKRGT